MLDDRYRSLKEPIASSAAGGEPWGSVKCGPLMLDWPPERGLHPVCVERHYSIQEVRMADTRNNPD